MNTALSPLMQSAIETVLRDVYPIWRSRALLDQRRIARQIGPGHFSISAEPYSGFRTRIAMGEVCFKRPSVNEFGRVLLNEAPHLLDWISQPNGKYDVKTPDHWIACWCNYLEKHADDGIDQSIRSIVVGLDHLLLTGEGMHTTTIMLKGLSLPGNEHVHLGPTLSGDGEVSIHVLSPEEFSEVTATDITSVPSFDMEFVHSISTIVLKRPIRIAFTHKEPELKTSLSFQIASREVVEVVLRALHVAVPGHVSILGVTNSVAPDIAPLPAGSSSVPPSTAFMPSMDIEMEGVARVVEMYRMMLGCRPEIKVAAGRLIDAEGRLNDADTILDCAIGLETLLNPSANNELTFRVQLNYAFLGLPAERKARATELKELFAMRGKIVHGGGIPEDTGKLWKVAQAGKLSLRDTLTKFLRDPYLRKDGKLDTEYWLNRIVS